MKTQVTCAFSKTRISLYNLLQYALLIVCFALEPARANDGLVESCRNGNMESCAIAVEMILPALVRDCKEGDVRACDQAALVAFSSSDHATAYEMYAQSCNGGSGSGCMNLGFWYIRGIWVEKDFDLAEQLSRRGCELQDARACFNVAQLMAKSKTPGTDKEAFLLYEYACKLKHASACLLVGAGYTTGSGTEKDQIKAVEHFKRSCELGEPKGCEAHKRFQ